jgi:uncharacterized membrane protein YphA (DoxX/SURF4 family)
MLAFARGRPGLGLLLQRGATAFLIFTLVGQQYVDQGTGLLSFLLAVLALFVAIGLFTTIASGLAAILTVVHFFLFRDPSPAAIATTILFSLSLSMIGAGAYSLDALLFGFRRIDFPNP